MKKILITGSTGFIGSNLVHELKSNFEVVVLLRKKNVYLKKILKKKNIIIYKNNLDLNKKLSKLRIDIVIHCATHYIKKHNISDINKLAESNIVYGNIILENLRFMKVKKFINFTTVWENFNGIKNSPYNLYAFYKKSFSELIKLYNLKNRYIKFYNLSIADTFGFNDNRNKIITVLKKNYKRNKLTKIISNKLNINLLNVKDISRAIVIIIKNNFNSSTYNLYGNNFNICKLINNFNLNNKKKIKVRYLSNNKIKEKIYFYNKLKKWKPEFSTTKEIFKIIKS